LKAVPNQVGRINRKGGNKETNENCRENLVSEGKLFREKSHKDKLARGCDRCGYNKCAQALEWHHPNDDKAYEPSNLLRDGTDTSYKKYLEEVEKCELLCANCHREIHAMIE
jgi:hypothetical protein